MRQKIIKQEAYHLQVYGILKQQILDGTLASGSKITENGLAAALDVSRSPVREAMRMLEQDDLVISTSQGLIVNPMKREDMEEVYECRMVLESYAARCSAKTLTKEELDTLEEYVRKATELHDSGERVKVIEVNTAFHNLIISGCHNEHFLQMIRHNDALSVLARTKEFSAFNRDKAYLMEHQEIVDALRKRDPDLAESVMRRHIQNDLKFYCSQVEKM